MFPFFDNNNTLCTLLRELFKKIKNLKDASTHLTHCLEQLQIEKWAHFFTYLRIQNSIHKMRFGGLAVTQVAVHEMEKVMCPKNDHIGCYILPIFAILNGFTYKYNI